MKNILIIISTNIKLISIKVKIIMLITLLIITSLLIIYTTSGLGEETSNETEASVEETTTDSNLYITENNDLSANIDIEITDSNMELNIEETFVKFNDSYVVVNNSVLEELSNGYGLFTIDSYGDYLAIQYGTDEVEKELGILSNDSLSSYMTGYYDYESLEEFQTTNYMSDTNKYEFYKTENSGIFINNIDTESEDSLESLINNMYTTSNIGYYTLGIDEIGDITISDLSIYNTEYGFYYGEEDKILRIYDYTNNKVVMYITNTSNNNITTDTGNYELYDKSDNLKVYISKEFSNEDNIDYGTMTISNETESYLIRLMTSDNESVLDEIVAQIIE